MELYEGSAALLLPSSLPRGGSSGSSGGGGSGVARLGPDEAVAVLRLRVDFASEEVERAGKALLQLLQPGGGGMAQ